MILNKKYAFLTAFIFSFLSAAVAMDNNEDIFNGTYVIKNVHTNKFIGYREKLEQTGNPSFVEDFYWEDEYHEGDETVIIHPGIFKESICSIEKSSEGYSIKNYQFEGYLFIKTESRVAVWTKGLKTPSANCYFDILKGEDENKDKYFFKSKKFHDYLSFDIIHNKIILSNYRDDKIYFTVHQFSGNIFNIHVDENISSNSNNTINKKEENIDIDQEIVPTITIPKKKTGPTGVIRAIRKTNIDQEIVPTIIMAKKKKGTTVVVRSKKKTIIDQNIVPNNNKEEEEDGNDSSNDDENNKN